MRNDNEALQARVQALEEQIRELQISLSQAQRSGEVDTPPTPTFPPLRSGRQSLRKADYVVGSRVGILSRLKTSKRYPSYEYPADRQGTVIRNNPSSSRFVVVKTQTGKILNREPAAGSLEIYDEE